MTVRKGIRPRAQLCTFTERLDILEEQIDKFDAICLIREEFRPKKTMRCARYEAVLDGLGS